MLEAPGMEGCEDCKAWHALWNHSLGASHGPQHWELHTAHSTGSFTRPTALANLSVGVTKVYSYVRNPVSKDKREYI